MPVTKRTVSSSGSTPANRHGADHVSAVLTGDVIDSTRLRGAEIERVRAVIAEAANGAGRPRSRSRGDLSFFRGDAWQLFVADPAKALRTSLLTRALLKSRLDVETRIAIAIGAVENRRPRSVGESVGEVFSLSGKALDAMSGHSTLTGALSRTAVPVLAEWFPTFLHLCDALARPWTRRQAEIVSWALSLDDPKHEKIAKSLDPPVTKQTVTESLSSAQWRALADALKTFESTDWERVCLAGRAPASRP
jgi:hypothetical protein